MLRTEDIQIRDPFILPLPDETRYYLFGSTDTHIWSGPGTGFDCYFSSDLHRWDGPYHSFRPPKDFWATENFWAPEVHGYLGKYYLFASFKAPDVPRGTQIFVSSNGPIGPYLPHSDGPVTPPDWECLDGTLYLDQHAFPWLVFCHEWVQVHDGEMCAIRLTEDLTAPVGDPLLLFRASDAPWVMRQENMVTDGPFLYRANNGDLLMLWSSFTHDGYYYYRAPSRRPRERSMYAVMTAIITFPDFPAFPTPEVRPVEAVLPREFVREGDLQHAPHFGHRQRSQRCPCPLLG